MRPSRKSLRAAAHDFALGLAAALGQAPFGLWPVALTAYALALGRIARSDSPAQAFGRGLFFGAGHFAFALSWIIQPFFVDPVRHGWMAPFAILLMAFGLALFWGASAWLSHKMRGGVVLLALILSLAEYLRGHILTGFPWALPGHIWLDTDAAQLGSLIGGYGLTALTLLIVALPQDFRRKGAVASAVLIALSALWSVQRLSLPEPDPRGPVRIVQPNIAQSAKWDPDEAAGHFQLLLDLSQEAPVDLVIWPETAVPYLIREQGTIARAIGTVAGVPVATGYQRAEDEQFWNALGVFDTEGRVSQNFDKVHLVPFGEYIPMGDLAYRSLGIRAFASQVGAGYSPGAGRALMDFGPSLGRAMPLICYEAIFPGDLIADPVAGQPPRADWLLQITNDAWFGTLTGPYQHFAQVRLRAIEQGLPLVRAANTGISAVVDGRGRIARDIAGDPAILPLGEQGVIDAILPGPLAPTPYARFGDWPLLGLLLCSIGLHLLVSTRRKIA